MATIIELKQSLFEDYNDESYSYAHCISANLALSKGIATEFRAKYTDRFEELENQNPTVGNIVVWKNRDQYVYNLVTKEMHYHKPTYTSFTKSLQAMKNHAVLNSIKEIRMPKIGCGLDKLIWKKVKGIISKVFKDTGINIQVYYIEY